MEEGSPGPLVVLVAAAAAAPFTVIAPEDDDLSLEALNLLILD